MSARPMSRGRPAVEIASVSTPAPFQPDQDSRDTQLPYPTLTETLRGPYDGAARVPYPRRRVQWPERARVTPADETRRALPVERAFVVHLRPEALPEEGLLVGRVEHVVSGRNEHFDSLPELLAFLGRTVRVAEGLRFNETR